MLHRFVYHYRQELEYCWPERFEPQYGCLRDEAKEALDGFLDCGVLLDGAVRAVCEQRNHSESIPFSCERKFSCASCDAKRALLFGERRSRILDPLDFVEFQRREPAGARLCDALPASH